MLNIDQPEPLLGDASLGTTEPDCVDLVALTPTVHWLPKRPMPRPDPSFVTQLIATAAQAPQTRNLRRASLADAQTAYSERPLERRSVTRRTRQII